MPENTTSTLLDRPTPPLNSAFRRLVAENISNPLRRLGAFLVLWLWAKKWHVEEARQSILAAFEKDENPFWKRKFPFQQIFYPGLAISIVLKDDDNDHSPVSRAAKLIVSALEYRDKMLKQELEADAEKGRSLDMGRHFYLFSRNVRTYKDDQGLSANVIDHEPTDHIVVAVDGVYFKLKVLHEGQPLSLSEVLHQIQQMVDEAVSSEGDIPFGLLTTLEQADSVEVVQALRQDPRNHQSMQDLDSALFFVAIDTRFHPQTLEETARGCLIDNHHNRDYRKSIQIVVTGNGKAAIVPSYVSGLDGSLAFSFSSWVAGHAKTLKSDDCSKSHEPAAPLFAKLDLQLENRSGWDERFNKLNDDLQPWIYPKDTPTVHTFDGIGRKTFRSLKISSDAAMHCALHLAFKHYRGRIPRVSNFMSMRSIKTGRIHRYSTSTKEMIAFVGNPTSKTLQQAMDEHRRVIRQLKVGDDVLYFLTSLITREEIGAKGSTAFFWILKTFMPQVFQGLLMPDILASSIRPFPEMAFGGRAGARIGFPPGDAIGGHYLFFEDKIMLCVCSHQGEKGHEAAFAEELEASLKQVTALAKVREALDRAHEGPLN